MTFRNVTSTITKICFQLLLKLKCYYVIYIAERKSNVLYCNVSHYAIGQLHVMGFAFLAYKFYFFYLYYCQLQFTKSPSPNNNSKYETK